MKYLITGGTGSLGNALIKRLLGEGHDVVVYSRDEYKQHKMAAKYNNDNLKFFVGDVRDRERTIQCFKGVDYVIHAAALKHVPVGESEAGEVIKTNVLGTMNVIEACKVNNVEKAVLVATDKACHPVNLYGATKLTAEKLFIAANLDSDIVFSAVRYGNVVGSRGSVIEYLLKEKPKTISATDERMTRFWISLEEAVKLVIYALNHAEQGDIYVPLAPASKIIDMFKWLSPGIKINYTGIRPGEKLHELMINKDESTHTLELADQFVIKSELLGFNNYVEPFEYSSETCWRITKEEFMKLI